TLERGYYVESKRGGGGYIRIQRVDLPSLEAVQKHIRQTIGDSIDQARAEGLIYQLRETGYLTEREAHILNTAISREVLSIRLPQRDEIRARLLKSTLLTLLAK